MKGATLFDSIHNVNDFFSAHWLAEAFPSKLSVLAKQWKTQAASGKASTPQGLLSLAAGYLTGLAELPTETGDTFADELTDLHLTLLNAMGIPGRPVDLHTSRAETPMTIPLLARVQMPAGDALHVLQARPANELDDLFGDESRLVNPLLLHRSDTKVELVHGVRDAVQQLFLTEDSPRYLLVVAGGWAALTDVERWAEGRYLGFDISTALDRRDSKPTGELAWHAGLWSADVLLPADDGSTLAEEYSRDSVKHAVGVSEDLREGLRVSVELIANAVIAARRAKGLPVEGEDELPRDLTGQSLRFLYRILFLLFAESRPELGVLPVGATEYAAGYGLDRFRELVQEPLADNRDGTHLHDSLRLLFRLVNDGYGRGRSDHDGLNFEPLRADLFEPTKALLVDGIDLPNHVLQEVLGMLLLSKKDVKRARGYVSYAQLGINQLGAVYEGLMSYSGFIAERTLVELAKDGEADKGTWLVPIERVGDYDAKHVVEREDRLTGTKSFVTHARGSFVYRLSGRDRQRSASYYTPEVLTRTVVKHALAELISDKTPASTLLEYRICEPALGSGAFLNEAINQIARSYLDRRQVELDRTIEPEDFQGELQKVKAYLALHRGYGVDLNQTAVELAEVSLWLNVMHPGLQAPWFGLHLRRGNSLIGGRRAVYDLNTLAKRKKYHWATAPTDRPLLPADGVQVELSAEEVHHFLLPAAGWGSVGGAKQAKELAKDRAESLRKWSKSVLHRPDTKQKRRLAHLAMRVERMWDLTRRRLEISEREVARNITVWGQEPVEHSSTATREQVENALFNPESPYQRLRLVMNLWCALFYWPVSGEDISPPDMSEWLDTLEDLLGLQGKAPKGTTVDDLVSASNEFEALGELDDNERVLYGMKLVLGVAASRPWVGQGIRIAERESFFHWELDFAQVFARGGFDIQVGNPPWVRPTWAENVTLAEFDPFFMLTEKIPEKTFTNRRAALLQVEDYKDRLLLEAAAGSGLNAHLGSNTEHPVLMGMQTNLYTTFMERTWRSLRFGGCIGMLHPEGHFSDPKAGALRQETYSRLRRHWQFINEALLFDDIGDTVIYGIHVYGDRKQIRFQQMSSLVRPETIDESLEHDGKGERPGIQFPWGGWDTRGHASRLTIVDDSVLADWAKLFDAVNTDPQRSRLLRPLLNEHLTGLATFASARVRLSNKRFSWTRCFEEDGAKKDGTLVWRTEFPQGMESVILQGPHFTVAQPFAKQPNENCKSKGDYSAWDLLKLPELIVPRTNYQQACDGNTYQSRIPRWDGRPSTDFWRLAWRRMTQSGLERSLTAAIIPPGPAHVHTVHTLKLPTNRGTALIAGLWASLPFDYLIKVSGKSDISDELIKRFPAPLDHPAASMLLLRILRLNCLTLDYAPLWDELYERGFTTDSWTSAFEDWPTIGVQQRKWTMSTPLRTDFERRATLVEIDALVAIMLGLTANQLALMYTGQFGVLRKYEYTMWFDNLGTKIAKEPHAKGVRQQNDDYKLLMAHLDGQASGDLLERYVEPFVKIDREAEMRAAHAEFTARLGL